MNGAWVVHIDGAGTGTITAHQGKHRLNLPRPSRSDQGRPLGRGQGTEATRGRLREALKKLLAPGLEKALVFLDERLLVTRTVEATPQTHYSLSDAGPEVTLAELVQVRFTQHRVEEVFEAGKCEAGLAHYEMRSWVGWHHHMTLSLLALWFLVLERRRVGGEKPRP